MEYVPNKAVKIAKLIKAQNYISPNKLTGACLKVAFILSFPDKLIRCYQSLPTIILM